MKSKVKRTSRESIFRLAFVGAVWGIIGAFALWQPFAGTSAAVGSGTDPVTNMYRRSAPQFDLNEARSLPNLRQITGAQFAALESLKAAANASDLTVRWNEFGGSPDVIYDFASQPLQGTPEEAARAFISQNAGLFGLSDVPCIPRRPTL